MLLNDTKYWQFIVNLTYAKEIILFVVLNSLVHQPLIGGTLKNSSHSPCRIAMSDNTI